MSFFGGGSSGGGQTQTTTVEPYAPAQPALNQIISEYIIKDLQQQVMLHQLLKQHKVSHNKK